MTRTHVAVVLSAVAIAAAAWIDPVYIPLVLLGPLLTGLVAGARGAGRRLPAVAWALAGMLMLVTDLAIHGEEVLFHAVVTLLAVALVRLGAAAGGLAHRRPATA